MHSIEEQNITHSHTVKIPQMLYSSSLESVSLTRFFKMKPNTIPDDVMAQCRPHCRCHLWCYDRRPRLRRFIIKTIMSDRHKKFCR